jgi:ectoine hydroxylase-related dioxygenase (phytanoyl-CoA dioxygenase family)
MNEMVIAVTRAVLGHRIKNTLYTGNTALPSRERQPVHADTGHLWPRLEVAHPPVHLVVNVPLVDVSPENGSTEIWPGTHRDTTITADKDIKIPPDVLEQRRARVTPIQPIVLRGGVLIRDMRLWHAGMPNRTEQPRPMIAMLHVAGWLDTGTPLTFPKGTEAFFQHPHLTTCARFVAEPIDYIQSPSAYEYEK